MARSLIVLLFLCLPLRAADNVDVLVYGGTPGGIAAALAAAKEGRSVLLVEPTARIGGLVTSGLSHTDFHSFESLTGAFLHFSRRVEEYYIRTYGNDSEQAKACFRGTFAEPKVNLLVFEAMLAEHKTIAFLKKHVLSGTVLGDGGITSVELKGPDGTRSVKATVFIDASYEGDLMAMAKVPYRVGREAKAEFSESLAPDKADGQLQAYNFRWMMTREPSNRVTPTMPLGYKREDFAPVLEVLATGKIKKIFDYPKECVFKAQTPMLPNGKYDINDVSLGLIRLSLPGKNLDWPEGTEEQRTKVIAEHTRDQVGLLYFLQNDPEVPAKFRDEAKEWGWCKDEFTETDHLPPQLYVREARRMRGAYIYKQADSMHAPNDVRAVLHREAIAMGDYGNNCHGTFHDGPRFGGRHTGELYNPVPPYQIPYGALYAKECKNLLVPVAASSTHIGFCALRLEPIWMSLGQAAGHAAALMVEKKLNAGDVQVTQLQRKLYADGSATIYVSDVLPGHPDFAAVQWWGTLGGLHGLHPMPAKPGQRGKNLHGQYFEAWPGHAAELEKPLEKELLESWQKLAEVKADIRTRGDFIRAAYKASSR